MEIDSTTQEDIQKLLVELWNLEENKRYSHDIANFEKFRTFCSTQFGFIPIEPTTTQQRTTAEASAAVVAPDKPKPYLQKANTSISMETNTLYPAALAARTQSLSTPTTAIIGPNNTPMIGGRLPNVNQPAGLYSYKLKLSRLPLSEIVDKAQKYVSTKAHLLVKHEVDDAKLIDAVDQMKAKDSWSLRQPKKFIYKREKSHYDHLLDGVHLLALDFHQERIWKVSMSYFFALQCAHHPYHQSGTVRQVQDYIPLTTREDNENLPTFMLADPNSLVTETADSLAIVPVYDFMEQPPSRSPDSNKRLKIAKVLNDERLYFASLEPLIKSEMLKNTIVPAHPPNLQIRGPVSWTPEEDDFLMKCTPICNQNWLLLAEMLSTGRRKKLDWDCYSRYQTLAQKLAGSSNVVQTSSMGMGLVGMLAFSKYTSKRDEKRKAAKHSHFFDGILKVVKKRENSKAKKEANSEEKKPVNMNMHSSHQIILQKTLFDSKNVKPPAIMAELKYSRQKKMELAAERKAAGLPMPHGATMGGTPVRPSRSSSPMPNQAMSGGSPRPPLAPARPQMTMSSAQVQNFMQRQNMMRQFPMQLQQSSNAAAAANMMNLMPTMQRFMYRQPVAGPQVALQQQQQLAMQQSQHRMLSLTPEMVAMIEEAKRKQAVNTRQAMAASNTPVTPSNNNILAETSPPKPPRKGRNKKEGS